MLNHQYSSEHYQRGIFAVDCTCSTTWSIFISLFERAENVLHNCLKQKGEEGNRKSERHIALLMTVIVLQIALLDMDLKRLKKMPFYLSLDNEIVSTYKESIQEP
jgi:hypothetical protein